MTERSWLRKEVTVSSRLSTLAYRVAPGPGYQGWSRPEHRADTSISCLCLSITAAYSVFEVGILVLW